MSDTRIINCLALHWHYIHCSEDSPEVSEQSRYFVCTLLLRVQVSKSCSRALPLALVAALLSPRISSCDHITFRKNVPTGQSRKHVVLSRIINCTSHEVQETLHHYPAKKLPSSHLITRIKMISLSLCEFRNNEWANGQLTSILNECSCTKFSTWSPY